MQVCFVGSQSFRPIAWIHFLRRSGSLWGNRWNDRFELEVFPFLSLQPNTVQAVTIVRIQKVLTSRKDEKKDDKLTSTVQSRLSQEKQRFYYALDFPAQKSDWRILRGHSPPSHWIHQLIARFFGSGEWLLSVKFIHWKLHIKVWKMYSWKRQVYNWYILELQLYFSTITFVSVYVNIVCLPPRCDFTLEKFLWS